MIRPRFTIGRLMLVIAGSAGALAIVRTEIGGGFAFLLIWGAVTWVAWRVARIGRRWALGVLAGLAVPIGGLMFWVTLVPVDWIGLTLPLMLALFTAPWLVAAGWAWILADRPREPAPRRLTPILVVLLLGFPMVTALTFWPLHAAFWLWRPGLDRLADRVAAGAPVAWPARVGPYTFVGGTADPKNSRNVALFLIADPNGPQGFVRLIGPHPDYGTIRLILPSAYDFPLGAGWHLMSED